MDVSLTAGAVTEMLNGEVMTQEDMMPILQVADLKVVHRNNGSGNDRYMLWLSDGIRAQQGMLNTSLNVLVTDGNVKVGSIVKLTHFVCYIISNRRVVMVLQMEVIAEQCGMIGKRLRDSIEPVDVNTQSIGGGGFEKIFRST